MIESYTYLSLAKETLENYRNSRCPAPQIDEKDYSISLEIFTRLALKHVTGQSTIASECPSEFLKQKVKVHDECQEETARKVKEFVIENARKFYKVCNMGVPFSLLTRSTNKTLFRLVLEREDCIIAHLLMKSRELMQRIN